MTVYHDTIGVRSDLHKPMFHDVTDAAKAAVAKSGIRNGTITVYSAHTTCSVIIQEESHDTLYDGTKHLLQDMLDRLEFMVPTCRREGQYLHPGPAHIKHAEEDLGEEAVWSLNTDAHIRSAFIGRSETIPIVDGEVELGQFGQIYFVDFDGVRERDRTVHFQLMGE
ncbi:MAG: YjbQ family protein [Candidatus Limnocylindrales bacterium]